MFLVVALIFLGAALVQVLLQKQEISSAFLILAAIMGCFSLFYGLSWLYWGRKEKAEEEAIRAKASRQKAQKETGRITSQEFILPKASLTEAAFKRFLDIVRWSGIAVIVVFLLITGIQFAVGSMQGPLQLIWILLFCLVITLPGLIVQWIIYKKYERSVPARILLYPGKLVIDERIFAARDIREIRISSDQVYNQNSPAVYRNLLVKTDNTNLRYRIDYRTGTTRNKQPFWEGYRQFAELLAAWGEENRVSVIVEYMD